MATIRMRCDGTRTDRGSTALASLPVGPAASWLRASGTRAQQGGRRIRWKSALLLASSILAVRQAAIASPGDPFGGDDAGCIPPTAAVGKCEDGVQKAYLCCFGV